MSACAKEDVTPMHARLVQFIERDMEDAVCVVPYTEQRKVARLRERTRMLDEQYDEPGTKSRVRARRAGRTVARSDARLTAITWGTRGTGAHGSRPSAKRRERRWDTSPDKRSDSSRRSSRTR